MIYLISTDEHRDSINLKYYFTDSEKIKNYIKWYRKDVFNESVRNIEVNFKDLKVTFEWIWNGYINDSVNEDWEKETYYLFKVKNYG